MLKTNPFSPPGALVGVVAMEGVERRIVPLTAFPNLSTVIPTTVASPIHSRPPAEAMVLVSGRRHV